MKKIIIGDVISTEHNWILDGLEGDFIWLYADQAVIANPYGCTIRNLITSLIQQDVIEIYVIGLYNNNQVTGEMLEEFFQKERMCEDSINALEYLFTQMKGSSLKDWILGLPLTSDNIKESVKLLKHHPVIPNRVKVTGYLAKENEKQIIQIV